MHKISNENKRKISENVGIPYEQLTKMSNDEITAYIEKKTGKKMDYSNANPMHTGSGDDSVLIDNDKCITLDEFNKKTDEAINSRKPKKYKHKSISL